MNDEYTKQQTARIHRMTDDELNEQIVAMGEIIEHDVKLVERYLSDDNLAATEEIEESLIRMRQVLSLMWKEWSRRLDRSFTRQ